MAPLFILSTILLITGTLSIFQLTKFRTDILGSVIRSFIIMTAWPIMIAYTIPNILHLKKVAYFYAVVRIIEVGISGMIIYLFYYKQFYLFVTLSDFDMSISDYTNPRLLSIGAPNSNDAAFVLLGAFGLIAYRLFNKFKILDLILSIIALFSMLFTWSRSVLVFIIFYLVLILGFNKKINKIAVAFVGMILLIISIIAIQLFEERKANDDRLQTHENAATRQHQMIDYISAIPNLPFLWGMLDDSRIIAKRLNIRGDFSSENYTLETFTKNGILAGLLFIIFFTYFIISFWISTKNYLKNHKENKNNVAFVIAVFATFLSLFLMTQSSLFRNNLIIWIMIGFMSVIKQQSTIEDHEE